MADLDVRRTGLEEYNLNLKSLQKILSFLG